MIFKRDVFPAPDDPMMYNVWPGIAYPEAPLTIYYFIVLTPLIFYS